MRCKIIIIIIIMGVVNLNRCGLLNWGVVVTWRFGDVYMAESTFAWLSVSAKRGATTLIARRIVKAGWDSTFGELLHTVGPDQCATFVALRKSTLWKMKVKV